MASNDAVESFNASVEAVPQYGVVTRLEVEAGRRLFTAKDRSKS